MRSRSRRRSVAEHIRSVVALNPWVGRPDRISERGVALGRQGRIAVAASATFRTRAIDAAGWALGETVEGRQVAARGAVWRAIGAPALWPPGLHWWSLRPAGGRLSVPAERSADRCRDQVTDPVWSMGIRRMWRDSAATVAWLGATAQLLLPSIAAKTWTSPGHATNASRKLQSAYERVLARRARGLLWPDNELSDAEQVQEILDGRPRFRRRGHGRRR